jgi:hypothetical protein
VGFSLLSQKSIQLKAESGLLARLGIIQTGMLVNQTMQMVLKIIFLLRVHLVAHGMIAVP